MPISTPETERAFKVYGSALETKKGARMALSALEDALHHGPDLEPELRSELEAAIGQVRRLLASATEAVDRLRPGRIEDRGYSAADRDVAAFAKGCGCDDTCGGGSCGGCGGKTP